MGWLIKNCKITDKYLNRREINMSKVKYLIFGNGYLGNRFYNFLHESIIADGRINTIDDIFLQIEKYHPEIIVNCIGKTGKPTVDWCESHREETFFSNVTVPTMIAECCTETDIYMVHMGSGCIYETNRCSGIGFSENDKPNFKGSFYSRTKIFAEKILEEYDNVLQLRIRMPIDNVPSPRNLIDKLIKYEHVINVPNSITYIHDFIAIAKKLIDTHETGIFNITNGGAITHKEILEMYQQIVDPSYELPEFIPVEKLDTVAKRSNCILYNTRLEGKGIQIRHVLDAVESCMKDYAKYIGKLT